jgi:fused signal recognition particle receptor
MLSFLKRDKDGREQVGDGTGWAAKLRQGLAATRTRLATQLAGVFGAGRKIDEALFEEMESVLLSCDVGVEATAQLLDETRSRARTQGLTYAAKIRFAINKALIFFLTPL